MDKIDIADIEGPVYITPMSSAGLLVYHLFKENGIEVLGFCDADKSRVGRDYLGCPVLLRSTVMRENPDARFVVVSSRFREEIAKELGDGGVSDVLFAHQFLRGEDCIESGALNSIDLERAKGLVYFLIRGTIIMEALRCICVNSGNPMFYKSVGDTTLELIDSYFEKHRRAREVVVLPDSLESAITVIRHIRENSYKIEILTFRVTRPVPSDWIEKISKEINGPTYIIRYLGADVNLEKIHGQKDANSTITILRMDESHYAYIEVQKRCIFTHIPKNSGTALNNYFFGGSEKAYTHTRLVEYKLEDEEKFARYFKFAIVRNPWDRLVSYHFFTHRHFRDRELDTLPDDIVNQLRNQDMFLKHSPDAAGFRNVVLSMKIMPVPPRMHQYYWVCDDDGNLLTDYIGRFENLEAEYRYIGSKIGVDPDKPIPHLNATSHRRYQDYYDDETREIVREVFKKDIELFGYDF